MHDPIEVHAGTRFGELHRAMLASWMRSLMARAGLIVGLPALAAFLFLDRDALPPFMVTSLFALSMLFVIGVLLAPLLLLPTTRRLHKAVKHDATFTLRDEGVLVSTPTRADLTEWDDLHRVSEAGPMLLFYRSARVMTPLPTRAFEDAAQLEAARALIREKMGAKARLKK